MLRDFCRNFFYAASAVYLYRNTSLPDIKANFVDVASINVLGRTALETMYVFHYVFNVPSSEEDKDFRYFSWVYSGLLERQNFTDDGRHKGKRNLSMKRK